MFRHRLFRFGWVALFLLSACAPILRIPDAPQVLPSPAGDWTVKLTQSGGLAGVMLTAQVSSDGRLIAENQRTGRSVTQSLPPQTMAQIVQHLSRVLQITPVVPRSGCADCFLYSLELTSGGKPIRIEADDTSLAGSGAAELIRLLQQLRDQALATNP